MSVNPEQAVQFEAALEPSRLHEIATTSKYHLARAAFVLGIIAGVSSNVIPMPSAASAESSFANDYPDLDATDCAATYGIYSWCKGGKPGSPRDYDYRNCTDGAAYWVSKYTGVNVAGWGNAKTWNTNADAAHYAVYGGNSSDIEPGDIAQDDTGDFGHVGFVADVSKNTDGVVISVGVAELNKDAKGNYSYTTYTNKDAAGNFKRNAAGKIWNHFIDVNGTGKGLNNGPIAGSTSSPGNADGIFLHTTDTGNIYEMVGGAPVRQYNWGVLPEFHGQATDVSQAQVNAMPAYPRDGTFVNIQEAGGNGIYEFIGGAPVRQFNWGILNGFNPGTIRNINYQSLATLDHMRLTPADGTFMNIHEAGGNGVYEFVGGAPIRQYNWGILSGFPGGAMADANYQSLVNLDHMHAVPNNGSFINIHEAGGNGIYEFVGGAPIRQTNWGSLPGFYNPTDINYQSLVNLDHMNPVPSDGTFVNIQEAGGNGVYEFVGGAPLRLYNWGILPNFSANMPNINYTSLVNLDHMNAFPNNGEFVASIETGIVYRTAGGAALRLYNQGGIPGYNGAIWVNQQTLDTLDHLRGVPADGTIIEGVATQTYWQVQGGKRVATAPNTSAVVVDEQTVASIPM